MRINCVIIEDLQVAADYLTKCCKKSGRVEVYGHFPDVGQALEFLNDNSVDLLFLDVEMPGASGFELLDHIAYNPKVILTTSKEEYAYNAYQYNVADFLKKPFTYKRFLEALQKVTDPATIQSISVNSLNHIFIKSDNKLIRLNNEDILFIETYGNYVRFVTVDKKYIVHNSIRNLENKVNKAYFLKVHRSYIINVLNIDDIRDASVFINGTEIPIGRTHRAYIMSRLNIL